MAKAVEEENDLMEKYEIVLIEWKVYTNESLYTKKLTNL